MDLIIAAAGKGTRLKEHTKDIPKHIIEVAGKPFIYYLLDAAVEAHFHRIIVVGGYHYEKLKASIEAYEIANGTEIITINQFEAIGEDKYGTACPLLAVEKEIMGDRFVYTMGDHMLAVKDLENMQMSTRDMIVATYEHSNPERFGVVEENSEHQVVRIVEKPTNPTSNKINVGLYTLSKEIFPIVHTLESSQRNEYEITDAINQLAQQEDKTIRAVTLQGHWVDLGRPEDIHALETFLNTAKL